MNTEPRTAQNTIAETLMWQIWPEVADAYHSMLYPEIEFGPKEQWRYAWRLQRLFAKATEIELTAIGHAYAIEEMYWQRANQANAKRPTCAGCDQKIWSKQIYYETEGNEYYHEQCWREATEGMQDGQWEATRKRMK